MKAFNGFEAKAVKGSEHLPAGGYVAEVKEAKIVLAKNGREMLQISFDIAEGDKKEFFKTDFLNQSSKDKKWKGVYRLFVPTDDGSEKDVWAKRTFGNAIWSFEESNNGFHWAWNEADLKGKLVGVLYRDKEWEHNGNTGWTTECCALTDIASIREGSFKMPKAKELPKSENAAASAFDSQFSGILADDADLPF